MRLLVVAATVMALNAPVAWGDPWDEILSIARRIGYDAGYIPSRPRYVERYGPSNSDFYDGYVEWPNSAQRRLYVRNGSGNPAREELLQMDYALLRDVARVAATDFDRWLNSIPAGEVWRKHFETPALLELLTEDQGAPPSADERQSLMRILGVFDQAVGSADLNELTSRPSARTLQAALRELATPPEQRLIRQLSLHSRMLNRTLGAFSTGVTWQRYLALPDNIVAAFDKPPGGVEPQPDLDREELDRILVRYDLVSRSAEYARIAGLPEFQATHQRLTELVYPTSQDPPPAAVAEELPSPELQTR